MAFYMKLKGLALDFYTCILEFIIIKQFGPNSPKTTEHQP